MYQQVCYLLKFKNTAFPEHVYLNYSIKVNSIFHFTCCSLNSGIKCDDIMLYYNSTGIFSPTNVLIMHIYNKGQ